MINTAEQNFSSVFILDSLNNVQMKVLKSKNKILQGKLIF